MQIFLIIIFYFLINTNIRSQTYVYVGIDVIHISDVDVKNQTFYAEFYLNMKWQGKQTATNFEFFDSKEITKHFYEEWTERDTNWLN